MCTIKFTKFIALAGLVLGIVSGCATSPQEESSKEAPAKSAPAPAPAASAAASGSYTVARGDNLWNISAKQDIYGNAYQWPLLYKANSDKIKDADLIYPGQNLAVNRSASGADISAAIRHAKTRGAWSLGVVEESDKAYLAGG